MKISHFINKKTSAGWVLKNSQSISWNSKSEKGACYHIPKMAGIRYE